MPLTSKQRAFLRSRAHGLQPVVHVGASGVTDAVVRSLLDAFNTRELLKVRVQDGAPDEPYDTADRLVEAVPGAEVAQTIGRVIVLYRPFPDDPEIRLPT